jgi:hypothetical protein
MMGTFGGALEARQIDASDGKLTADVTGEVEQEDGVLVIRRISRFHAPGCARGSNGEGRARACNLCDELPPLPDPAQCDPAHLVCRLSECFGMTDDEILPPPCDTCAARTRTAQSAEILWSVAESLLEDILDRLGVHFSRMVVKGSTVGIQH